MSTGQFRSTTMFAPRARASVPAVDRATFVVFAMADRRFAVPVESVERVLRDSVAAGPATTAASVNYGGQSYAVADLASALGVEFAPTAASRVLVLSGGGEHRAVIVDRVLEVATIDAGIVEAADAVHDGIAALPNAGVRGVFTRNGAAVIVLDVSRLLDETLHTAHGPAAFRKERSS